MAIQQAQASDLFFSQGERAESSTLQGSMESQSISSLSPELKNTPRARIVSEAGQQSAGVMAGACSLTSCIALHPPFGFFEARKKD